MKIDTHCHLSSEGLAQTISKHTPYQLYIDRDKHTMGTAQGVNMTLLNEDERICDMDEWGIDANVISVGTYTLFTEEQLSPRQMRLKLSQVVNDYLASICQRYPKRLMAFADISLPLGDDAIKEMIRSLNELHLEGIGLLTSFDGKYLDSPEFKTFFEEANRLKATIFVHPFLTPSSQGLMEMDMYRVVGFPAETSTTFCRMAYSGFIEKYPHITFILSHVGGAIPFLWQRINTTYESYSGNDGSLSHPPTDYLKRCYYDTALSDTESLMLAFKRIGDHLMLGTDYPFSKKHVTRTLSVINAMDVSDEIKNKIFGGNALSLLKR
jgi:predicted TIM-barrel fold metal-dependent hydrolase